MFNPMSHNPRSLLTRFFILPASHGSKDDIKKEQKSHKENPNQG